MSAVRWLLVILLVIAAVPAALFTIQNANWTAQLSLDLHLYATQLKQPMPVPHLMWMAFGVGLPLVCSLCRFYDWHSPAAVQRHRRLRQPTH